MTVNATEPTDHAHPLWMQAQAVWRRWLDASTPEAAPASAGDALHALDELHHIGLAVARILAAWQASPELQAAGLLHPLVCQGILDADELVSTCGERTAFLCREYRCLVKEDAASAGSASGPRRTGAGQEAARYGHPLVLQRINAFQAGYRDAELAFLHTAVLWQRFDRARQTEPAPHHPYRDEGRLLLGPFLEMLGMRELKSELDAWLTHAQHPAQRQLAAANRQLFSLLVEQMTIHLPAAEFIYRENTQIHNQDGESRGGLPPQPSFIVDVLVADETACYEALYWVHRLYTPLEGALADTLPLAQGAAPRCLSTAVMASVPTPEGGMGIQPRDPAGNPVKKARVTFRITTRTLHEINSWGLAAYQLRGRLEGNWQGDWWIEAAVCRDHLDVAPAGALPDTLYVFSPHGELFRFNRGATVVDYAYHVHSDLADRCRHFYVNGVIVEPAATLRHLDLVELEHDPDAPGPTEVWLEAARTNRARGKIERFLRRHGRGSDRGQQIVDERRRTLEEHYRVTIPEFHIQQAVTRFMRRQRLAQTEDVYAEVAAGRLDADRFLHPLFADEIIRQVDLPRGLRVRPQQVALAQCCRPRPGDDIVERIRVLHGAVAGLKVHRRDCPRIGGFFAEPGEIVDLKWRLQPTLQATALLDMTALDEDGLLGDAVAQFYALLPRVTLRRVEAETRHGIAHLRFSAAAESQEVLDDIVRRLRELPNRSVDAVLQMSLPWSEQEELLATAAVGAHNPYSRLPVHEREMFFGRARELGRVSEWLHAGAGCVWLRGQKRVGKTSLLLHLKRFYLEQQGLTPIFVDFQLLGNLQGGDIFYLLASALYAELQGSDYQAKLRGGDPAPPLRELFAADPPLQFAAYLRHVRHRLGGRRIVLLMDEFSRTIDAHRHGQLDEGFFAQWRGLLLGTMPGVSYVIVVQQRTYDLLAARHQPDEVDPTWEVMELGEQLLLRPLDRGDVRRLIEWPIRNFLEYSPETVDRVVRLTGGSPFLIQSFCFKLVTTMTRHDRQQVTEDDVDAVRQEFMQPGENVFAHLLDLLHGLGYTVAQHMAQLAEELPDSVVSWAQVRSVLPGIQPDRLRRTLQTLVANDILVEVDAGHWRFASLLFQQWLALNAAPLPS